MSIGNYVHGDTIVHNVPAGAKITFLFAGSTLLFLVGDLLILVVIAMGVIGIYYVARIPTKVVVAQVRHAFWIFLLIFLFQLYTEDAYFAGTIVVRFATLLLLASLVTLTTQTSHMIAAMEACLSHFKWAGINPAQVSLGVSLALRFIPVVASITAEVKEAQKVRGLERSVIAVAIPVIIRTLKMSDDIANAIDARSFDP